MKREENMTFCRIILLKKIKIPTPPPPPEIFLPPSPNFFLHQYTRQTDRQTDGGIAISPVPAPTAPAGDKKPMTTSDYFS